MRWNEAAPAPEGLSAPDGDLWVFGYGSLMWDPGFPHDIIEAATVDGWHRSFCVYSTGHRGTPEWPGLVVGLSPGGSCRGFAIRADPRHKASTLDYLWQREMALADGYRPQRVEVLLDDGRRVEALTFVARIDHEAYAGDLPLAATAARIATAHGLRGSNRDYLERTLARLAQLGISDPMLTELGRAVAAISG